MGWTLYGFNPGTATFDYFVHSKKGRSNDEGFHLLHFQLKEAYVQRYCHTHMRIYTAMLQLDHLFNSNSPLSALSFLFILFPTLIHHIDLHLRSPKCQEFDRWNPK